MKIYPQFADRFVEGIEPRWIAAVGAAKLARIYKLQPELVRLACDGDFLHDEL